MDRFSDQFSYRQMLWAASFNFAVIHAQQFISYLTGDLSEKLPCFIVLAVAIVIHQISHNVIDVRSVRQDRVADVCTAGTITIAGRVSVFC